MSMWQTMQISGETADCELSHLNLHCFQKLLPAFGSERVKLYHSGQFTTRDLFWFSQHSSTIYYLAVWWGTNHFCQSEGMAEHGFEPTTPRLKDLVLTD